MQPLDTIDTDDYSIALKDCVYHRGIIPLYSGTITVSGLWEIHMSPSKSTKLAWEAWDYYHCDAEKRFGMSYVEFLHPGSGDYGLNLSLPYVSPVSWETFYGDYEGDEHAYPVIRRAYDKYHRIIQIYNDRIYNAGQDILHYQKEQMSLECPWRSYE